MENKKATIYQKLFVILAIVMTLFQIYTSMFRPFSDIILQNYHIALAYTLIFLAAMDSCEGKRGAAIKRILYLAAIIITLVCVVYMVQNYQTLVANVGRVDKAAYIIGALLAIVTLYATYKSFGPAIPILTILFISYMFWGKYVSWNILHHGGFSVKRVISTLNISLGGMYGSMLNVAATYIALFMIFGGLLGKSGAGDFFMDFSLAVGGKTKAGPALAAVMSSALMGSINGSAVANVATTGAFTIPMMKDRGYEPEFAGAVEAVASTGGMILPPVMGVGAFIMADITGITYSRICLYALVPALLYYLLCAVTIIIHSEKLDLEVIKDEHIPSLGKTFKNGFYYLFPIASIIWAMAKGYSVTRAALIGISVQLVIIIAKAFYENRSDVKNVFTAAPWAPVIDGCVDGIKSLIGVSATMACIGMMVDCLVNTGLTNRLMAVIIKLGGNQQLLSLFIVMLVALVLGMGVPTSASYILLATMTASSLVEVGFSLIAVHLFIYYFAIIGAITPPVGNAAIVASKMAKGKYNKTCWHAVKMSAAAFILPFLFAFRNELLLVGSFWSCAEVIGTCTIGLCLLSSVFEKYLLTKSTWFEEGVLLIAAAVLIYPAPLWISLIALAIIAVVIIAQRKRKASLCALHN